MADNFEPLKVDPKDLFKVDPEDQAKIKTAADLTSDRGPTEEQLLSDPEAASIFSGVVGAKEDLESAEDILRQSAGRTGEEVARTERQQLIENLTAGIIKALSGVMGEKQGWASNVDIKTSDFKSLLEGRLRAVAEEQEVAKIDYETKRKLVEERLKAAKDLYSWRLASAEDKAKMVAHAYMQQKGIEAQMKKQLEQQRHAEAMSQQRESAAYTRLKMDVISKTIKDLRSTTPDPADLEKKIKEFVVTTSSEIERSQLNKAHKQELQDHLKIAIEPQKEPTVRVSAGGGRQIKPEDAIPGLKATLDYFKEEGKLTDTARKTSDRKKLKLQASKYGLTGADPEKFTEYTANLKNEITNQIQIRQQLAPKYNELDETTQKVMLSTIPIKRAEKGMRTGYNFTTSDPALVNDAVDRLEKLGAKNPLYQKIVNDLKETARSLKNESKGKQDSNWTDLVPTGELLSPKITPEVWNEYVTRRYDALQKRDIKFIKEVVPFVTYSAKID